MDGDGHGSVAHARPTHLLRGAFLAFLLLGPADVEAQVLIGARGGFGITNVYGADVGSGGPRTAFAGGLWMRFPLTGGLGLQIEGLLAQKGFSDSADDAEVGLDLDYVDIPVLLQLALRGGESWSSLFSLGGALGIRRGCSATLSTGGVSARADCSLLNDGATFIEAEDYDVSVVFGTGVRIASRRWVTTLELRGQLGATTALRVSDPSGIEGHLAARNGGLSVHLGVGLPLGGRGGLEPTAAPGGE